MFLYEENKLTSQIMKRSLCLAVSLFVLNLAPVFGQPNSPILAPPTFQQRLQSIQRAASPQTDAPELTKFNLDFPGGTPAQLVKAIEKAMGKPLNVIIPDEDANKRLPALKLNEIIFPQLSETLRQGSFKQTFVQPLGSRVYQAAEVGYYFKTSDSPATDTSIWFFYVQNPPPEPAAPPVEKVCRFFSLSPYLERGFTVDDITTAIQTGWKMAGSETPPQLSYHKETKLLIAFGEPKQLDVIYSVLQSLPSSNATRNELEHMSDEIWQLQVQLDQLNRKIALPPTPMGLSAPK